MAHLLQQAAINGELIAELQRQLAIHGKLIGLLHHQLADNIGWDILGQWSVPNCGESIGWIPEWIPSCWTPFGWEFPSANLDHLDLFHQLCMLDGVEGTLE